MYYRVDRIVPRLKTGRGLHGRRERPRPSPSPRRASRKAEKLLGVDNLYDPQQHRAAPPHQPGAARPTPSIKRDVDYVVKDGEVIIVDEFTGRLMPGRRWTDGLHQAIEAKEGVKIERENQTLATITFQNYFRMYKKLAGMTGTAETEAAEFDKIYKLDVVVIPTNRPMIRKDYADVDLPDREGKVQRRRRGDRRAATRQGQPVLVGTISIEKSERLAGLLEAERHPPQGAERQAPRAGSRDHRPGRPQGRRDHRHQHGRPRHRHPAGRQPGIHGQAGIRRGRRRLTWKRRPRECYESTVREDSAEQVDRRSTRRWSRWAACTSSAPSATSPPHRQPAARPRRPPGRPRLLALLPVAWKTT